MVTITIRTIKWTYHFPCCDFGFGNLFDGDGGSVPHSPAGVDCSEAALAENWPYSVSLFYGPPIPCRGRPKWVEEEEREKTGSDIHTAR